MEEQSESRLELEREKRISAETNYHKKFIDKAKNKLTHHKVIWVEMSLKNWDAAMAKFDELSYELKKKSALTTDTDGLNLFIHALQMGNARMAKKIYDSAPKNELCPEEKYPLGWFGLIVKDNWEVCETLLKSLDEKDRKEITTKKYNDDVVRSNFYVGLLTINTGKNIKAFIDMFYDGDSIADDLDNYFSPQAEADQDEVIQTRRWFLLNRMLLWDWDKFEYFFGLCSEDLRTAILNNFNDSSGRTFFLEMFDMQNWHTLKSLLEYVDDDRAKEYLNLNQLDHIFLEGPAHPSAIVGLLNYMSENEKFSEHYNNLKKRFVVIIIQLVNKLIDNDGDNANENEAEIPKHLCLDTLTLLLTYAFHKKIRLVLNDLLYQIIFHDIPALALELNSWDLFKIVYDSADEETKKQCLESLQPSISSLIQDGNWTLLKEYLQFRLALNHSPKEIESEYGNQQDQDSETIFIDCCITFLEKRHDIQQDFPDILLFLLVHEFSMPSEKKLLEYFSDDKNVIYLCGYAALAEELKEYAKILVICNSMPKIETLFGGLPKELFPVLASSILRAKYPEVYKMLIKEYIDILYEREIKEQICENGENVKEDGNNPITQLIVIRKTQYEKDINDNNSTTLPEHAKK